MKQLVNIGFGNLVNADKIVAIVGPDSAPSKRMIVMAKEQGRIIDATQGRRTRSIIVMTDDHVVLSALQPETIAGRYQIKDIYKNSYLNEKDEEDE